MRKEDCGPQDKTEDIGIKIDLIPSYDRRMVVMVINGTEPLPLAVVLSSVKKWVSNVEDQILAEKMKSKLVVP